MMQKYVDFALEISVIAARNTKGDIRINPVGENIHGDNILHTTVVPARVSTKVCARAQDIAYAALDVLKGAGVFGIEMFVTKDDRVLINEIAPRVHNTGHHTIQSSATSQFEQHLRAITGMPLGSTEMIYPRAVMHNIIGEQGYSGAYKLSVQTERFGKRGAYLHMYNKPEVRPGRKMGHFTLTDELNRWTSEQLIEQAHELRKAILFTPVAAN